MSVLTQGSQVYFIDPTGTPAVVEVQCATSFNPGGNPADQIEDTCLASFDRSYKPGLRTPGAASLGINADPSYASHILLQEMAESNPSPTTDWVIGWSDGTAPPTLDIDNKFVLPTSRTWFKFAGYVSDFSFDFQQNAVVVSEVPIQRTGAAEWISKVVA